MKFLQALIFILAISAILSKTKSKSKSKRDGIKDKVIVVDPDLPTKFPVTGDDKTTLDKIQGLLGNKVVDCAQYKALINGSIMGSLLDINPVSIKPSCTLNCNKIALKTKNAGKFDAYVAYAIGQKTPKKSFIHALAANGWAIEGC